ncbi:MAG TPA: ABC transporter ATP-binding protein [Candidatus Megamonas gallistercoris]|nr:ABC transporter ATP-binding protein [Candidatus Megamonas gallistercoris]
MNPILEIKGLTKKFVQDNVEFTAVDNISFNLFKGDCLAIVGESGCGKSTTANLITRLKDADSGQIFLYEQDITHAKGKSLRDIYKKIQMIFQFPQDSFNPHQKMNNAIIEPLINNGINKDEAKKQLPQLLDLVGLNFVTVNNRYPHQLSGGQCQRAAIARAIAVKPEILICDEATSALDVINQKQIVDLLKKLQQEFGLSIILITHDLALVRQICNRIIVMYQGKIIEANETEKLLRNPQHEYTKLLIRSTI